MRHVKLPFLTSELLLALITGSISCQTSFVQQYQARVSVTQAQQPHWVTPLVTVTPRLEQELRTDFVRQSFASSYRNWNDGNSKGLELIPERHTEVIFNVPPFFSREAPHSEDGFGDVSFLLKERIFARDEEQGNAIVPAFLGASIPTGRNGNGSCRGRNPRGLPKYAEVV